MANAYPEKDHYPQDNPAFTDDDVESTAESHTSYEESITSQLSDDTTRNADIDDVILALENGRTRKATRHVDKGSKDKLESPFRAKVVAVIIGLLCSLGFGYAAYSEAILASKIKDPWMRGLRMRNSYVISCAGVFLGVCIWILIIWLLIVYFRATWN